VRPSVLTVLGGLVLVTSSSAQTIVPGDRPSGNIRATRSAPVARHGMIATSQSLASVAGLRTLQEGGNAIDAAITAAAVLAVIEPSMNGIGGDFFALVYDAKTRTVYGLDSSGRSSRHATPEEFARRGVKEIPVGGPLSVNVPGVIDGWSQMLSRFGTRPLAAVLQPAIGYAKDGFGVHEIVAGDWAAAERKLSRDPAASRTFLPGGRAPRAGDLFSNPNLAKSLELIAKEGRDAFYKGALAQAIAADMKARDGLLDLEDLAAHKAEWVEPIFTTYRGHDLFEMPPSTQGFVALEMLNLMEGFDVRAMGHNSADYLHLVAEAKKVALRRPKRLPRRPGFDAERRAADVDLEGLRGEAAAGDQPGAGRSLRGRRAGEPRRPPRPLTSRVAIWATRSTSPWPTPKATWCR
jgi:gamma-glutamyltranspeptidase/glutathione hydrolase